MSIDVLTYIWKHSPSKGSELLLLLALADCADLDGTSHPAVPNLAHKCRMTERNVQLLFKSLVASKQLSIQYGQGPHGCHLFRLHLPKGFAQQTRGEKISGEKFSPNEEVDNVKEKQCTEGHVGENITGENFSPVVKSSALLQPQISPLPSLDPEEKDKDKDPPIIPPRGQNNKSRTKASQQPNTDYTPGFNKAWALYPRKEKKVDTFTIWRERGLEARAAEIAEKIARLQVTLWKQKEMQYIPLPTTWFNEARYEDDLIPLDMAQEIQIRERTTSQEYRSLMASQRFGERKLGHQRHTDVSEDDGEVIDGVSYRIE